MPPGLQAALENEEGGLELIQDFDDDEDDDILQYSAIQLMCFDEFLIVCHPCDCHGYIMLQSAASVHINYDSDLMLFLWNAFQFDELPRGTYAVAYWAASMFGEFAPVFLNREVSDVKSLIINVVPSMRMSFLKVVSRLFTMGVIPCMYLRKMVILEEESTLVMCSEPWYSDAIKLYLHWQSLEIAKVTE